MSEKKPKTKEKPKDVVAVIHFQDGSELMKSFDGRNRHVGMEIWPIHGDVVMMEWLNGIKWIDACPGQGLLLPVSTVKKVVWQFVD